MSNQSIDKIGQRIAEGGKAFGIVGAIHGIPVGGPVGAVVGGAVFGLIGGAFGAVYGTVEAINDEMTKPRF